MQTDWSKIEIVLGNHNFYDTGILNFLENRVYLDLQDSLSMETFTGFETQEDLRFRLPE